MAVHHHHQSIERDIRWKHEWVCQLSPLAIVSCIEFSREGRHPTAMSCLRCFRARSFYAFLVFSSILLCHANNSLDDWLLEVCHITGGLLQAFICLTSAVCMSVTDNSSFLAELHPWPWQVAVQLYLPFVWIPPPESSFLMYHAIVSIIWAQPHSCLTEPNVCILESCLGFMVESNHCIIHAWYFMPAYFMLGWTQPLYISCMVESNKCLLGSTQPLYPSFMVEPNHCIRHDWLNPTIVLFVLNSTTVSLMLGWTQPLYPSRMVECNHCVFVLLGWSAASRKGPSDC